MKSIKIFIPLYVVLAELFTEKWLSLKFKGDPFFRTPKVFSPWIWIAALEWDKSVTPKSLSLKTDIILSFKWLLEMQIHVSGPDHKILVSLL